MHSGLKPEDVFTPRAASVNPKTYISRPDLERALALALRLPKHIVIHGESGSGKTWLYKKVLADGGYHIEVANMGLTPSAGTIGQVLRSTVCQELSAETEQTWAVDGGVPGLAKLASTKKEKTSTFHDPFLEALRAVRARARDKQACLVFDNLEQVVQHRELVRELAGYLILLDDERYASFEVKILLVGTSAEIRDLIAQIKTSASVANRISEIPEVARLTQQQAATFTNTGFFDLLGCELEEESEEYKSKLNGQISYHSDRIPLHIQELCFYIACLAQDNDWVLSESGVVEGVKQWIKSSLVADVSRVQANLNAIATRVGRRNQVLYCLGKIHNYDFTVASVESSIKHHFPASCSGVTLNVAQILSDLANSEHPLIRKNPNSSSYRFIDPKYRIVVRWLLYKAGSSEEISLRDFDSAVGLWNDEGA